MSKSVKTLKPVTFRDPTTGALTSPAKVTILEGLSNASAAALISAGLAGEYNLVEPSGSKTIKINGTYDVTTYASANVQVPGAAGEILITENGEGIDVSAYATANVAVPNPSTGTLEITAEGTYDVTNYASVTVAIAAQGEG